MRNVTQTLNSLIILFVTVFVLLFATSCTSQAQDRKPSKVVSTAKAASVSTGTYTDKKGVSHKVYTGSRGGKYILVTSKTGNEYKKYIKS